MLKILWKELRKNRAPKSLEFNEGMVRKFVATKNLGTNFNFSSAKFMYFMYFQSQFVPLNDIFCEQNFLTNYCISYTGFGSSWQWISQNILD